MYQWTAGICWALVKDVLFVLEVEGLGGTGVLCALLYIGKLCDHGCEATFNDKSVRTKNK